MRLGEQNTKVIHQRQEIDRGDGRLRKWEATGKQAWVSVEQLSGDELIVAQRLEPRATVLLKTHWQSDIRAEDRFVTESGDRTFNIVAVNNFKNMNRELQLTCIEIVNQNDGNQDR